LAHQFRARVGLPRLHSAVVDHQIGIAGRAAAGHQIGAERAGHGVGVGDGGLVDDRADARARVNTAWSAWPAFAGAGRGL
jgi:hypothetical protein